jgi:hypothetical protein
MPLRAFQCPNLVRQALARDARPNRDSYRCPVCLFGPALPKSLAVRAMLRSPIALEELPCLADAERVHLRVAEPPEWPE